MAFEIMTVTTKGAELLASATSLDNLTIVGCDADDTIYSTINAAKAVSSRPATPLRNTTDVTILFAQNNNLFTRAYFGVGTSATADVNTLYLYGKLDSDSTLYVIAVASSSTSTHLPVSGDPTESFQALFNFMYNVPDTSAVTASSASFATISEFNDLASRVVTTHLQGQSTTGEFQTIYGGKVFVNQVSAQGGLVSNAAFQCFSHVRSLYNNQSYQIYVQYTAPSIATAASQGFSRIVTRDSDQNNGTSIFKIGTFVSGGSEYYHQELIRSTDTTSYPGGVYWKFSKVCEFDENILCGKNIMPLPDNSTQGYANVDIGSNSSPVQQVCAKLLRVDEITNRTTSPIVLDGTTFTTIDLEVTFGGATMFYLNGTLSFQSSQAGCVTFNTEDVGELVAKFNGGVEFNPATSSGKVVFYQQGFEIKNSGGSNNIVIDGDGILRGDSTFNIGSYADPINLISSTDGNIDNLYPHVGYSNSSVGNTNRPYKAVYATRLHGVINYPVSTSGSFLVPVGAIVLAKNVWSATDPGATVVVTSSTNAYVCDFSGNASQYLSKLTEGSYVTLSCAAANAPVLLLRIS